MPRSARSRPGPRPGRGSPRRPGVGCSAAIKAGKDGEPGAARRDRAGQREDTRNEQSTEQRLAQLQNQQGAGRPVAPERSRPRPPAGDIPAPAARSARQPRGSGPRTRAPPADWRRSRRARTCCAGPGGSARPRPRPRGPRSPPRSTAQAVSSPGQRSSIRAVSIRSPFYSGSREPGIRRRLSAS